MELEWPTGMNPNGLDIIDKVHESFLRDIYAHHAMFTNIVDLISCKNDCITLQLCVYYMNGLGALKCCSTMCHI